MKSAVTDAIKLAAKLFGVGLYLYERKGNPQPATGSTQGTTQPNNQQQTPQFIQQFQAEKMMAFFGECGISMEQVLSQYQLQALEKMPYNLACAIVSGQHPDIQALQQQHGKQMNAGIAGSAEHRRQHSS